MPPRDLVFTVVHRALVLHGHEEGGVVAEDDGAGGVLASCFVFGEDLGIVAVGDHEEAEAAVAFELHALDGAVDDAGFRVFEDHGSRGEVGEPDVVAGVAVLLDQGVFHEADGREHGGASSQPFPSTGGGPFRNPPGCSGSFARR
jgi:hypothetical protein